MTSLVESKKVVTFAIRIAKVTTLLDSRNEVTFAIHRQYGEKEKSLLGILGSLGDAASYKLFDQKAVVLTFTSMSRATLGATQASGAKSCPGYCNV